MAEVSGPGEPMEVEDEERSTEAGVGSTTEGAGSAAEPALPPPPPPPPNPAQNPQLSITPVKVPTLSVQPVTVSPKGDGEETKKVVPGLKIIGLSSEMRRAMAGQPPEDEEGEEEEEEDDEDEDGEEDDESEEEEAEGDEDAEDNEEAEEDEEEEEEEEAAAEEQKTPEMKLLQKTPKVTIRKVMKVATPGGSSLAPATKKSLMEVTESGKKRGRPSKAEVAQREKERQEAIARGEPDPELKRKRRKPPKLQDGASSEEETKEEKKKRKKEEREEKKRLKKKAKSEDTEDSDEEKPKKKKGRQKKILTEEELKEREEVRKEKYRIIREKQKAKLDKRKAYLIRYEQRKRDERKAQKVEEKKRTEAHNKRMAELKMQYLDDNAMDGSPAGEGQPGAEGQEFLVDENSQSSLGSISMKKKKQWGDVGGNEMAGIHNPLANVTAETLFEYKWPLEGRSSEHFFLQEQVTEFLGVKSFKRKYPDCPRRMINMEERDFLIEMKIVNETQADLGLTAIPSSSVLDIMCQDFYEKYEDYYQVVKERKERTLRNQQVTNNSGTIESSEAVKLAADYNKRLNAERKTQRTAYFDMQTFAVHFPKTNKGRMRIVKKPAPGVYPVAMIPGQFVDSYKSYNARELRHFPLNSVTAPPPPNGLTTKDMQLGSDGDRSDSDNSSSSGSSSGSDSDSESESEAEVPVRRSARGRPRKEVKIKQEKVKEEVKKETKVPLKKVDEVKPGAICKNCQGHMNHNRAGQPEMLLHCSKCNSSCHPTCVGLVLDLINYVTGYEWECTDCKQCMTCQDPADEDKMLFCDLCDRGYHIYCVGLQAIPNGRWHCSECSYCESCGCKTPIGDGSVSLDRDEKPEWVFETKTGTKGDKIYSHTMCLPCHKQWKKHSAQSATFCAECNGVFGRSGGARETKGISNCWVCTRPHHSVCVGLDKQGDRFICGACQRRTQEKTIAGGRQPETPARPGMPGIGVTPGMHTPANQQFSRTPATTASYSRSGRRVTQINFANQF